MLYTCVLWKLLGKYFSTFFSSLFQIFCVKLLDGVFQNVRRVLLYVRMVILVVRTIRLICLDVHSSCLDVFVRSLTWHYVQTSLKFRSDGEPCKVKSHSPWSRMSLSPLFWFFLSSCAFFLCFLCVILKCTCHLCNLSPPQVCF
jgi:hypothetical protein